MKILKIILTILPLLIFTFSIFIIVNVAIAYRNQTVPKVFGYSYMIVVTGSMEPTIMTGDFIVVREKNEYFEDQIVTFYYDINNDGILDIVTHRIISIVGETITLRGDAALSDEDKQEITQDDIIGQVVQQSRFLGQFFSLQFLRNKNIIFAILIFSLSIFTIYQAVKIIKIRKEDRP